MVISIGISSQLVIIQLSFCVLVFVFFGRKKVVFSFRFRPKISIVFWPFLFFDGKQKISFTVGR